MREKIEFDTRYEEESPLWQEVLLAIGVVVVGYFLLVAIALI